MTPGRALAAILLATLPAAPADTPAQQVEGRLFEDRDGDGILDAGEPALQGWPVRLFGAPDAGGSFDTWGVSGTDGAYAFTPGDGCFLLDVPVIPGWRMSGTRADTFAAGTPGYSFPVGQPRPGLLEQVAGRLGTPGLRYSSLGDSIAFNFNLCRAEENFWYSKQVRDRLECVSGGQSIALDQAAVKGQHTDDLLVDDHDDLNNVHRIIEAQPDLITLSMIGNDLLDVDVDDPAQQSAINIAVREIIDSRANLQEALSSLVSEVPAADIVINTLYDNLADECSSTPSTLLHRQWIPIIARILQDLAWGQMRRLQVAEVQADMAAEGQDGSCTGYESLICRGPFALDEIHPTNAGYTLVREKVWEAAGGVLLGPSDPLARSSRSGVDHGYLRRLARLYPSVWETRGGASVANPGAALTEADGGAAASITLGSGGEEFRVAGFPDWLDEYQMVRAIAGVRYRTTGTVGDDFYRIEASFTDLFDAPPGHAFSPTSWNFSTPLVGGGGPDAADPATPFLVIPDVPAPRDVSATLTMNPVLDAGAAAYRWPAPDHADLATTTLRVATAADAGTAGNDAYTVELETAWLDLYGWEKPRPAEVSGLDVSRQPDGDLRLEFDVLSGAERYNVYAGRLAALASSGHDHGEATAPAGPFCDAATGPAGPARVQAAVAETVIPATATYFLVTAHVDGVESPAGFGSAGQEIDRSQSSCR